MKRIILGFILTLFLSNFSLGQNVTNGGQIGIVNPDSVTMVTYFVGDVADTIRNFVYPSGGDPLMELQYIWAHSDTTNIFGNDIASGINIEEYYIPPTDSIGLFYYFRHVRRNGFVNFAASSNFVIVEILPTPVSTKSLNISDVNIFPNPVTEYLHIEFKDNNSSDWLVEIFDIKGALHKTIFLENVNPIQTINLQSLPKGNYLLQLKDFKNYKSESFKIVKE